MSDENQKLPAGHELTTLQFDPAPEMIERFTEWQAETRAELEAAGMTVTEVKGGTFIGHYDPTKVDPDGILG